MKSKKRDSIADGLPAALPPLHRAHRLQDRAAGVGFDWPDVEGPAAKVEEELAEVRELLKTAAVPEPHAPPILDAAHAACRAQAHFVVFPELSLTGYYPGDLLDDDVFLDKASH